MSSTPSLERPIPLFKASNGQVRIWDPVSLFYCRVHFRIIGSLVGTLPPQLPQMTGFFSLPLELLKEEVALLLDLGSAVLYDDDELHDRQVSPEKLHLAKELYEKHLREYSDAKRKMSEQIRDMKIKDPKAKTSGLFDEPEPPIITPTSTLSLPWNENVTQEIKPIKFDWPATDKDQVRYNIFKSLWEKGFYISRGSKFGGDYLLYPGDPSRFHSNYIVTVASPDQPFSPLDFISMGRLGTTVKKTHAICSWSKEKGLMCISIEWTGWN